jgi:hypothetical protein
MALSFEGDLAEGEQVELLVLRIIQYKYPQAYKVKGYCREHDIIVPEINQEVEVKAQLLSRTNYFIETASNGKDSGLTVTTAKHFCIVDGTGLAWCQSQDLRDALMVCGFSCQDYKDRDGQIKRGYSVLKTWLWGQAWCKRVQLNIPKYLTDLECYTLQPC